MRVLGGLLLCLPLMFSGVSADVSQQRGGALTEVSIGMELFRWQEFDSGGNRLLTEQGPRVKLKLSHNNASTVRSGLLYNISGSLYGGDVEYDGQTQVTVSNPTLLDILNHDGVFVSSNTDYAGVVGEASVGFRAVGFLGLESIDLIGGIGLDSWTREISNGIDARNQRVNGLVEDYKIGFTRFAVGMSQRHNFWKGLWRVGLKYPFFTKETIDRPSLELEPGKEISPYFVYRFQIMQNERLDEGVFINFMYDGYRFSKSPVVKGYRQPKSNMDVFSLSIGSAF